jgi:hypothetical protein
MSKDAKEPNGARRSPRAAGASSRLTVGEANALLQSVNVKRFPIIASYDATVRKRSAKVLLIKQTIVIQVRDRDDPKTMLDVRFDSRNQCPRNRLTRDRLLKTVRNELHFVVKHEMDECFLVGGVRAFDQHPSDGPSPHGNAMERGSSA